MNQEQIKRIPYGVSDYKKIVEGNYYYVDKTVYIPSLEKAGDYLFFIRPRRFGKSLFLSMMRAYYDVLYKDQFEKLFRGTRVYDNPTGERSKYPVLFLNFSEISPDADKMEASFLEHVRGNIEVFIRQYASLLTDARVVAKYSRYIDESRSASDILGHLNRLLNESRQKMVVIIDEYDNFSNTLLSTTGKGAYHDLTHGDSFFRTFFSVLKSGTGNVDSSIARLFITGVSPVTMDDVTSGFNIGKNVTLDFKLTRMLGFTGDDTAAIIDYYKKACPILRSTPQLMELLTQWYGNYCFSGNDHIPLFNSDMILYFVDYCLRQNELPVNLVDRNVRIDYGKLRHLIIIDKNTSKPPATNGNFSKLKQIVEDGEITSKIAEGFPLEEMAEPNNFESLLFYFGLLTIDGRRLKEYSFKIPNETIKHLYFDYIIAAYKETGIFSLDLSKYGNLISDMAQNGTWRPLVEFITQRMKESLALRDLISGEKAVQTFLYTYLGLSDYFIVHTEKEMNKGYADIVMEPLKTKYPELNYSFLLEIKYVKSGMKPEDPTIPSLVAEAEDQLKRYARDEKFKKALGRTQLIKVALVFSGHEAVYIGDVA